MTDVPIFASQGPEWSLAVVYAILGLLGLAALWRCRGRVWQTTLIAAWGWALVSLVAIVGVEIAASISSATGWTTPARYAAAVTMFAPQIAVLGAKRPQSRMWQFIVASLLAVLMSPWAGALARAASAPATDGPWRWFLAVLVVVGWANYALSRTWFSAALLTAGQCVLLGAHLPWPLSMLASAGPVVGLVLGVTGGWLIALGLPRPRRRAGPWERAWLDFRDLYGSVWSLRVAERFNTVARQKDWPLRLSWRGVSWDTSDEDAKPDDLAAARRNLRMLLRLFVSHEWIAARLGENDASNLNESTGVGHSQS